MKLKIRLYKVKGGWRWAIKAFANSKVVGASSEAYVRRTMAEKNFSAVTGLHPQWKAGKLSRSLYTMQIDAEEARPYKPVVDVEYLRKLAREITERPRKGSQRADRRAELPPA